MDSDSNDSGTRLPEIKNASNKGSRGFNGTGTQGRGIHENMTGPLSGRGDNLSRHSSRKSVPVGSLRGTRTLKDAKKERHQVEKDAELLANRIALLKQEEMRTWKKIEETRKRARDVLEMKRKNEERIKKKMRDIKDRTKRIRHNQKKVRSLREQRHQEKDKIKQAVLMNKREEVKITKLEEKRNMRIKSEMMRRNWEAKKEKSKAIKEQLRIAELKKREYERQKLEQAKREFEERIEREIRLTKHKEKEVMQMEMIEMELIKKLQNTQNIQKSAYQELENALAQPSVFFHNQRNVSNHDSDRD